MQQHQDYYSVCIKTPAGAQHVTVRASSDYAAARHVCALTGFMATSERDVTRLADGALLHTDEMPHRTHPLVPPSVRHITAGVPVTRT